MTYKKCGFREKVKCCTFKPDDCRPDKCDFYSIEFTAKAVLDKARFERKQVIGIHNIMQKMKKCGEHKMFKNKYRALKSERNDKVVGMMMLSKAYMYLKRTEPKKRVNRA